MKIKKRNKKLNLNVKILSCSNSLHHYKTTTPAKMLLHPLITKQDQIKTILDHSIK